jgi:hypothetical protein
MDAMQIVSFRELNSSSLCRIREIYENSFPIWEREDFDELLSRGVDEDSKQFACTVNQRIIGFATASTLQTVGWSFLEYFALDHNSRGRGLGIEFWDQIKNQLNKPIVIEVEHPEQSEISEDELRTRQSRISFWRRVGFKEIAVPNYRVPRADTGVFEPLLLMSSAPLDAMLCSPRALITALYSEGYELPAAQQLADTAMRTQISTAR